MASIPYPVQNCTRQVWILRRKLDICLNTILIIRKRTKVREPVVSGHFGKIKLLMILNSYFIIMIFDLFYSHNHRVVMLSEYHLRKSCFGCSWQQHYRRDNLFNNVIDVQWLYEFLQFRIIWISEVLHQLLVSFITEFLIHFLPKIWPKVKIPPVRHPSHRRAEGRAQAQPIFLAQRLTTVRPPDQNTGKVKNFVSGTFGAIGWVYTFVFAQDKARGVCFQSGTD